MATFLPIRGTQSEIDATAIVDGQLLFTTDTNNIYIDNGTTRTLYRSVSTVQLSSQNTTADAIAFGKDSSGNYGYYEAGSSELKSFKKGNATVAQVLSPYTFSNASASGLTGTMANRGSLTFNPSSSTTQSLPMGYYSGGTLSTVNAYNAGFSDGTAILLGIGTSFNVSKYSYYGSLTTDDFVVEPASLSLDYVSPNAKPTYTAAVSTHVWSSCCITKSYDASTGVLTAYASMSAYSSREGDPAYGTSNTGAVKVYLMPKK